MIYYEVAIGGKSKGPSSVFTYSYSKNISIGTIVKVLLRGQVAYGFIVKISSKPAFKTLNIAEVFDQKIPAATVRSFIDLNSYYPYSSAYIAQLFMPPDNKIVALPEPSHSTATPLAPLNTHQIEALKVVESSTANCMIFGDTGTGKTRIYTHIIQKYLSSGKNVILLAPEIGLATYLYEELAQYFPNLVIYHSMLTPKQRRIAWANAQAHSSGLLLVGPRSALGLPLDNIGVIIMDESHDQSYRQGNYPFVSTKIMAAILAKNHGAKCIYGSATPSTNDYFQATKLSMPIARLTELAVHSEKNYEVHILDYADDKQKTPGSTLLRSSIEALKSTFNDGAQAMILSNRRGTARYISCSECGYEERCAKCDHLLVYHHDKHKLHCHFCQNKYDVPTTCPSCKVGSLQMRSHGTKAIENEIKKLFPSVSVMRFDTDNLKSEQLSEHTEKLKTGRVDCIIGTQMIAKGLDLPSLATLIVIGSGSYMPGYTSEENEFQLLYQVIGRAIRGHRDTQIYIQTSAPKSRILTSAVARNYKTFYDNEISVRQKFLYPPFCYMMTVHFSRKSSASVMKMGQKLQKTILALNTKVSVSSPVPNTTERVGDTYRWHIVIKSPKRSTLLEIAEKLGPGVVCELDPVDLP